MKKAQRIYELEAKLENIGRLNEAEVIKAELDGYQRGFAQAMQLFRQERQEIFRFAALTAVGNAKEKQSVKLLTTLAESLTKAVDEDINDKVAFRSNY